MSYEINISVKNLNETKYLAKVFSLKLKIPFFFLSREKLEQVKLPLLAFLLITFLKKK